MDGSNNWEEISGKEQQREGRSRTKGRSQQDIGWAKPREKLKNFPGEKEDGRAKTEKGGVG